MGAANGTIGGPPYACIFMDKVETGFHEFQKQTDGLFLLYWWHHFYLNSWRKGVSVVPWRTYKTQPNLKFTHESSKKKIFSLDLYSSLSNRTLYTDLDMKATRCYQYVESKLSHRDHANKSLAYSHVLRLSRLYSSEESFECHENSMKGWFLKGVTQRKSLIRKCPSSSLFFLGKSDLRKRKKKVFLW